MQEVRRSIYTSLRGQVRARVITTLNHNNVSGQCRDSISLPNKASSCEPSDGSKNTEVKKIDHIYPHPSSPQRFSSFQSLKVLVLTVLRPSYLYPYYIALRQCSSRALNKAEGKGVKRRRREKIYPRGVWRILTLERLGVRRSRLRRRLERLGGYGDRGYCVDSKGSVAEIKVNVQILVAVNLKQYLCKFEDGDRDEDGDGDRNLQSYTVIKTQGHSPQGVSLQLALETRDVKQKHGQIQRLGD